ncbi:MAG: glycoside hydrolase family 32 protein [Terracidiphilus sp.]
MVDRRTFLRTLGAAAAALRLERRGSSSPLDSSAPDIAQDPLRPEYHLMPPHNWMNDPNGPIWWKDKYHLFYQLNPHAAVWGDMHWGHAVSPDMIHWHHDPIALVPTHGGPDSEGCFSGSAVVFNGVPTLIYTGVQNAPPDQVTLHDGTDKLRETQILATADDDRLLRWTKLPEPVIPTPPAGITVTGFRDPCPWREADAWYLGIGSGERGKGGCVLLYRSQDLRHWEYLHKLAEGKPNGKVAANPCDSGEMWECPDFFALNGHHCLFYSTEGKVLWSTGAYDVHQHLFTAQREGILDRGGYYAPKSFLAPDGRRILWGWIRETRPESDFAAAGWAGVMSLPRVLTVGPQGQLEIAPTREIESLRGPIEHAKLEPDKPYRLRLTTLRHELFVPVTFASGAVSVRLLNGPDHIWELVIDVHGNAIRCGDLSFPLPGLPWPHPSLRLFLDGSVIESFLGGREALTSRVYSIRPGDTTLEVTVTGKSLALSHWPLTTISPDRLTT